jgi:MoxR-like ATPase
MENITQLKKEIAELAKSRGETISRLHRSTIEEVVRTRHGAPWSVFHKIASNRVGRGYYSLSEDSTPAPKATSPKKAPIESSTPEPVMANIHAVRSVGSDEIYVPPVDKQYVPWGDFSKIKKVIESNQFFPIFIAGHSGNGKTVMVEQACAKAKREYVRIQLTPETDEDDLIGGFRLINGETVFQKGPVIRAMERGAIVLFDEVDRTSNKVMCLQGILEGKPVLIKKTGEIIEPAAGFNVIATANTKGRGDDEGRYSAATVIDDAFLERFISCIEQKYPSITVESKILNKLRSTLDIPQEEGQEFVQKLCGWAAVIRKTYDAEGVEETISTRRLTHILKAYAIFEDRLKAIEMCVARFDEDTRSAFLDLYSKVDADANHGSEEQNSDIE